VTKVRAGRRAVVVGCGFVVGRGELLASFWSWGFGFVLHFFFFASFFLIPLSAIYA
jgi:hypothetical protein